MLEEWTRSIPKGGGALLETGLGSGDADTEGGAGGHTPGL